jgi:hypothetical protein
MPQKHQIDCIARRGYIDIYAEQSKNQTRKRKIRQEENQISDQRRKRMERTLGNNARDMNRENHFMQ